MNISSFGPLLKITYLDFPIVQNVNKKPAAIRKVQIRKLAAHCAHCAVCRQLILGNF